jgi:hypothetical protein
MFLPMFPKLFVGVIVKEDQIYNALVHFTCREIALSRCYM